MLEVVSPHAFVASSVHVSVDSVAVRFIVLPLAFVEVAVHVDELSFAVRTVHIPLAHILRAVGPSLSSKSFSVLTSPLSLENSACFKSVGFSLLNRQRRVVG